MEETNMEDTIIQAIEHHINVMESLKDSAKPITDAATAVTDTLKRGGKVVLFGNGGSSCDAQHIAAEMLGITEGPGITSGLLAISLSRQHCIADRGKQ